MRSGFYAYDLTAPARVLVPCMGHLDISEVTVGRYEQKAIIRRFERSDGVTFTIDVPCDATPHCAGCECDHAHGVLLAGDDIEALRGLLDED